MLTFWLEQVLMDFYFTELADKADLLKSAAQEKTEFEKCLIEARSGKCLTQAWNVSL